MHTEQKNNKKLKELYHDALRVKSAIPHPRWPNAFLDIQQGTALTVESWESFVSVVERCTWQMNSGPKLQLISSR